MCLYFINICLFFYFICLYLTVFIDIVVCYVFYYLVCIAMWYI